MSATQRPARRRSARLAFGNEDAQSQERENGVQTSKRMKKDDGGHTVGRNNANGNWDGGRAVRKRSVSYDEEDDGFLFTRTRSKKAKVAQAVPESVPEEEEIDLTNNKRKHVNPDPKLPEKEVVKSRRRSARVAGVIASEKPRERGNDEKKMGDVNVVKTRKVDTTMAVDEPVVSTVYDTTRIALPFSDTPVIKRNKEFRQHGSKGHRRSSTGLRGRRASSLIDNGSDALPHREVGITEFYKHIAGEGLSEPRRMKQLLTWCGTRAMEETPLHASDEDTGTLVAQVILKELLKDFSKCSEMSDWFSREDTVPKTVIKKPNPRNMANAAKVEELEKQVKGLREERANWETFFAALPSLTTTFQPTAAAAPLNTSSNTPTTLLSEINPTLLSDTQQSTILTKLTTTSTANPTTTSITSSTQNTLQTISSNLEFTIDRFADGIHKIGAYQTTAARVADTVLGMLARDLEHRDRAVRERAGTRDLPLGEVLRSLGRLDR